MKKTHQLHRWHLPFVFLIAALVWLLPSSATAADYDLDGIPDDWEFANFGSLYYGPNDDPDSDGLINFDPVAHLDEWYLGTHPWVADTDGDGWSDGYEVHTSATNPILADMDGDGLDDPDEGAYGADPTTGDTDFDGVYDGDEVLVWGTDPANPDSDGDGMTEWFELYYFGHPTNIGYGPNDDDNDGHTNAQECPSWDPIDPNIHP